MKWFTNSYVTVLKWFTNWKYNSLTMTVTSFKIIMQRY